jgi:hypothetical protein
MATVAATPAKVNTKAFRCTVYDEPGVLAKIDQHLTFFRDSDSAIIDFEPEMAPWTCILGEVGLAEVARLADRRHGGAVHICLTRGQEVA